MAFSSLWKLVNTDSGEGYKEMLRNQRPNIEKLHILKDNSAARWYSVARRVFSQ